MAASAISTSKLTKYYGDFVAVDELDLEIQKGEVFGLLGPNGAGKTTTILMLLGLTEPSSGRVQVVGLDPVRHPLEVKRRVGYLPDSVGFYPEMTGRQNLRYTAQLHRLDPTEAEQRIDSVLRDVGLADRGDDPAGSYSRGMLQRLGLADALLAEPDVLILDEPTAAIDPEGVNEILALIRELPRQRGVTILLASHLLQQVQQVCDRVGIFVSGRLAAVGSITELAASHGGRLTIEVAVQSGDPSEVLAAVEGVVDIRADADRVVVGALTDVREQISRALSDAGFLVTLLALREEELSEIYRRYFREDRRGDRR